MAYRLAIDLGSSSTVAVRRGPDGQLRPVLFDGAELLPSGVYADPGGGLVVGRDAERLARADPAAFEPYPKRRIDEGTLLLGRRAVDVPDVLAAVLARVVGQVGDRPVPAVLTYPAGWGAPRRQALVEAAHRAGLGPVELVSEPIAAAAYADLPPGAALCVLDLGAGTADVAVVTRRAAGFEVAAQAGLDVGGLDLDAALVEQLGTVVRASAPEVWPALTAPGSRDRLVLWQEVRAAKESLSRLSLAPVHVPGHLTDLHLTRDELDALAAPLLAPVVEATADVVARAGLAPADLAGVLLVGGGSRIPLLARLVHARLGVAPTVVERPETVVAEGALRAVGGDGEPAPAARIEPKRRRRWANPVVLGMALLSFLLPFATVSCGLPDGYGRAQSGGTTTYTGVQLVVGGRPDVPADQLRPAAQRRPDRLPPQPLLLGAVLAVLGGLVTALVVPLPRRRRALVAALAATGALLLLAGQAMVIDLLAVRVRAQSAPPAGKTARDFVGTAFGFWFTLLLLLGAVAGNLIGLVWGRRATAPAPPAPPAQPVTPASEGR